MFTLPNMEAVVFGAGGARSHRSSRRPGPLGWRLVDQRSPAGAAARVLQALRVQAERHRYGRQQGEVRSRQRSQDSDYEDVFNAIVNCSPSSVPRCRHSGLEVPFTFVADPPAPAEAIFRRGLSSATGYRKVPTGSA